MEYVKIICNDDRYQLEYLETEKNIILIAHQKEGLGTIHILRNHLQGD